MIELNKIEEIIKRVLVNEGFLLPEESLDKTDSLINLGLDSLDIISVFLKIEKELDITISDESISKCNTVDELITTVHIYANLNKKYKST